MLSNITFTKRIKHLSIKDLAAVHGGKHLNRISGENGGGGHPKRRLRNGGGGHP